MTSPSPNDKATVPATRHQVGFWIIAIAFTSVMAYSTVPTPLYVLYEEADGFPASVVTFIFSAYAVGVVASLYFAGHVSDWLGRRRIVLAAVLIEIIAAALFFFWPELPGLVIARFVNGVGVGILTATATAHLSELRVVARPAEHPGVASTIAGVANLGGLGLGPLIGGLFAEFLPDPLQLPHFVFLVLFAVAAGALVFVPETVEREEIRRAYRPQRVSIPSASRSAFFAAGTAAFTAFAVFGLFTSLAPTFLVATMDESDRLLAGAVSFSVFASACTAQVIFRNASIRRQLQTAAILLPVGLIGLAIGAALGSLAVFVVAGVVTGGGVGLLFRSALATAGGLAAPTAKGEALAAIFLIAYAGLCLPVLLIGGALTFATPLGVLLTFVVLVLAAVLFATIRMLKHHR